MSSPSKAILIVGPSERMRTDIGDKIIQTWPDANVDYYEAFLGRPAPDLLCVYDGIFIAHDLEIDAESGLTWLMEMRSAGKLPPVIMLTDSTESIVREAALQNGAGACMTAAQLSTQTLRAVFARDGHMDAGTQHIDPHRTDPNSIDPKRMAATVLTPSRQSPPASKIVPVTESEEEVVDVPGYRVERLLAHGGMSAVYRAVREGDEQLIALKVLYLGEEHDQELIHRFMREYASVARLSHPNVITIEERGFSAEYAYISMEYCPSGDLKGRIQLGLTPRDVLSYARQIALGLGAAHHIGLIHRDVKPANMLFREDGSLVVSDFGVAKDIAETQQNLTVPKAVVGTVYYVSPEQVKGEDIDSRSDLYGLGGVIYQMLTGKPPFVRQTRADILAAHVEDPVPRLTGENEQFQKLIDGLLAKDPDDRFQTAEETVEGLNWIEKSLA